MMQVLRELYDDVVSEPIPAPIETLMAALEEVEPGAMGGKAPGSLPFAGGESAGR